jgi:hypothetical protein
VIVPDESYIPPPDWPDYWRNVETRMVHLSDCRYVGGRVLRWLPGDRGSARPCSFCFTSGRLPGATAHPGQ